MKWVFSLLLLLGASFLRAEENLEERLLQALVRYEDFPHPGITFRDISPILEDQTLFGAVIRQFTQRYRGSPVDAVVALDARGFLFGAPVAYELRLPLVMVRKEGKLPGEVHHISYHKLYGQDRLILRKGALKPGQKVLLIDDFCSTGGSLYAASELVKEAEAEVFEAAVLFHNLTAPNPRPLPFPLYALAVIAD